MSPTVVRDRRGFGFSFAPTYRKGETYKLISQTEEGLFRAVASDGSGKYKLDLNGDPDRFEVLKRGHGELPLEGGWRTMAKRRLEDLCRSS